VRKQQPKVRQNAGLGLLIGATMVQSACGGYKKGPSKSAEAEPTPTLALYADCNDMQADIRSLLEMQRINEKEQEDYYYGQTYTRRVNAAPKAMAPTAAFSADNGGAVSTSVNKDSVTNTESAAGATNVQERGVDESDYVKIGAAHIYVHRGSVVKVTDRATLKELGEISVSGLTHITLYAEDHRLTVIGLNQANRTVVRLYNGAPGAVPTVAKEHSFRGDYLDTRLLEGQLITVFRSDLPMRTEVASRSSNAQDQAELSLTPVTLDEGSQSVDGVGCSAIAKPIIRDVDLRMSRVATINTLNVEKAVQQIAAVGGGDMIYMTTRNIYLVKQNRVWWPWIAPVTALPFSQSRKNSLATLWEQRRNSEFLYLTKVSITRDGQLVTTATGRVEGRVKDQWAFKELAQDNLLSVATTTGQIAAEGAQKALNHLYVLEQQGTELKDAAPVQHFAPGEDIRSVRHVGAVAYIVTFKKTDPLFAFDLSQPRSPKILGELKIPGFSTYMHPLADGRLLGVGFDAIDQGNFAFFDGIQVSLFDTKDPRNMARLDNHILGQRGSGSDVTGDHHAFYYDAAAKLIGIPVVTVGEEGNQAIRLGRVSGSNVDFAGAVLYRFEGDKINEVTRISHNDLMPQNCRTLLSGNSWWQNKYRSLDINRMFTLDGRLVSISRFGIKAHDLNAPDKVTTSMVFSGNNTQACADEFDPDNFGSVSPGRRFD